MVSLAPYHQAITDAKIHIKNFGAILTACKSMSHLLCPTRLLPKCQTAGLTVGHTPTLRQTTQHIVTLQLKTVVKLAQTRRSAARMTFLRRQMLKEYLDNGQRRGCTDTRSTKPGMAFSLLGLLGIPNLNSTSRTGMPRGTQSKAPRSRRQSGWGPPQLGRSCTLALRLEAPCGWAKDYIRAFILPQRRSASRCKRIITRAVGMEIVGRPPVTPRERYLGAFCF